MDFKALELAIKEQVAQGRVLENIIEANISVSELVHCGKKAELNKLYTDEEPFNPDIYTGYIMELFMKEALIRAYGQERVTLEKVYIEEFNGLRIAGHVDAVIEFEDKVVGIDIKTPKKVFAVGSLDSKEGILVDYDGLILNNPTYALQASLYKRMMEKSENKKVEFYLLYNSLVNGRDRVFMAVPVEQSMSDQSLERLIGKFQERKPAFRNECESYCRFKDKLCPGVKEINQEEPYTGLEKAVNAYLEALKTYENAKDNLNTVTKLLQQLIPDGTVEYGGMEFGWKEVTGYTLNKNALERFIKKASDEELKKVLSMLTHVPAKGQELNRLGLTEAVENVKFFPPNPKKR